MEIENKMSLRIREKRLEKNMTMEELGVAIGVQKSAVNKWEKGIVKNIKRSTIQKMAELFDCSPVWLMGLEDDDYEAQIDMAASIIDGTFDAEFVSLYEQWEKLNPDNRTQIKNMIDFLVSQQND